MTRGRDPVHEGTRDRYVSRRLDRPSRVSVRSLGPNFVCLYLKLLCCSHSNFDTGQTFSFLHEGRLLCRIRFRETTFSGGVRPLSLFFDRTPLLSRRPSPILTSTPVYSRSTGILRQNIKISLPFYNVSQGTFSQTSQNERLF